MTNGKALLVGSSGGHLAQLLTLADLWPRENRHWVTFDTSDAVSQLTFESVTWAHHPTTRHLPNLLRNLQLARRVLDEQQPDVVVSTGAGVAYPFFLLARRRGIRTVYIEVYDRMDSRTLTGRLCRPISDLFCVQWEEQRELLPRFSAGWTPAVKRLLVTVGTDHHRFDRLVQWADAFAGANPDVQVLVQFGHAAAPTVATGAQLLDHAAMLSAIREADAVVSHGGPATITEARRAGHRPICLARDPSLGEHVDGHQQRFVARLATRGLVVEVAETSELDGAVRSAMESRASAKTTDGAAVEPAGVSRLGQLITGLLEKHNAPRAQGTSPVTVLYLGGQGRSGSTLLERAVGQVDGLASVGEVVHLWRRGLRDNETCGCSRSFHDCEFWTAVGVEAFGGWHNVDADAAVELRYSVDRTRYVPLMLRPGLSPAYASRRKQYLERLSSVYRAMAKVAGVSVLVDSSKHASYAMLLAETPGVDLRLLHVVRDSPAVAYAWSKKVSRPEANGISMPTYGPTKSAVVWDVQNAIVQSMGRRLPYLRVRYEDFVESPKDSLLDILGFAGLGQDPSTLRFLDGDTLELDASHSVAGNPMRFQTGSVVIRRDNQWDTEMPNRARHVVQALTSPLRRSYGYGSDAR